MVSSIGEIIKERRKELGLTQEELAVRMGVKQAYISALEKKKKENPSSATLKKIADALDIFPDELIAAIMSDEEREEFIRRQNEEYQATEELSDQETELITRFRSLSPNRKLNAIEFVKSLQIMDQAQNQQASIKELEVS